MNAQKLIQVISSIARKIEFNKDFLTQLDNFIGDGDHGINMSRGFSAVLEKLPTLENQDITTILKNVGMILVTTVGGASGPLFGTAFMKAGDALKDKSEIHIVDFKNAYNLAIEGVKARGKAVFGEKTMLDAMILSHKAIDEGIKENLQTDKIIHLAYEATKSGVEYTKTIAATKGRASYLGDRSIGFQDPGATSIMFIFEAILESYK